MSDGTAASVPIESAVVVAALRDELANRGHHLSADSAGASRMLYILGDNDLALAVFAFPDNAEDAAYDLMRGGAWVPGMPRTFVVLPSTADEASLDLLGQLRAIPLLFDAAGGTVTFRDLDRALGAIAAG